MERLVLVHGSVVGGEATWAPQQPLAARYELVVVNRPGFPPNPPPERVDFEEDARWLESQLEPGDHVCGHSYGAIVAVYAAAARGDLGSLTLAEPPAFRVASHDPAVRLFVQRMQRHWTSGPREPRAFLAGFYAAVAGREVELPDPVPPELEQGARALIVERGPWEAEPPLERLAAAPFPKLVVSGGWSPAFEAVCDALARGLEAERAVLPGAGHSVQAAPGFNERLAAFLG